jgi:hypothetical protein
MKTAIASKTVSEDAPIVVIWWKDLKKQSVDCSAVKEAPDDKIGWLLKDDHWSLGDSWSMTKLYAQLIYENSKVSDGEFGATISTGGQVILYNHLKNGDMITFEDAADGKSVAMCHDQLWLKETAPEDNLS